MNKITVFKNRFKITAVSLFLFLFFSVSAKNYTDSILNQLELTLSQKEDFHKAKLLRIDSNKKELFLAKKKANVQKQIEINNKLFNEYQSFIYDSAFKYAVILNHLSAKYGNKDTYALSKLKIGFVLLSSGLFKEAIDTMLSIQKTSLPDSSKALYYSTLARSYYDLADYDQDTYYSAMHTALGNDYMDTALMLSVPHSTDYYANTALRQMKSDDYDGAAKTFAYMINNLKLSDHQFAIATSSLGYIYTLLGNNTDAVPLLARAAIADLQSSVKETVALRNLAHLLYKQGDIKTAYRYIKIALEDATFYNARHRKIEIASILPLIEGEKLNSVEKQKTLILAYAALISVLTIVVVIFLFIIFRQLKSLKQAKQLIQDTNQNLRAANHQLKEANKIKEIYIGYFFNTNSEYIDKIEKLQRDIGRKLTTNQIDDIKGIIRNIDLKKEREDLYHNFDKIFLKIFPDFVEEFNTLFKEEDRFELKDKELLNTDLRIFALIRMGIDDNEKIAKILEYSVNTIYTYKTKIKNKSIVPNDEFENRVMAIKAL